MSRPRRIEFVIAAFLLCCWALWRSLAPADGQTLTLQGVARSYSASYFVRTTCPQFFRVNDEFATRHAETLLELASASFGKAETKSAVVNELKRRQTEVKVTGETAWCSYQRASMQADGLVDLFR